MTPKEIPGLPDEHVEVLVAVGPIVFRLGSASILGQVRMRRTG
jgi:hypothetical protein